MTPLAALPRAVQLKLLGCLDAHGVVVDDTRFLRLIERHLPAALAGRFADKLVDMAHALFVLHRQHREAVCQN